jgi:hypothetical protein
VKALIAVAVLVALLGAGVVGCTVLVADDVVDSVEEAAETIDEQTQLADEDDFTLEVDRCAVSEFGDAEASGILTNDSGKRQGFEVEVDFEVDDVRVASGFTFVDSLDPGQSTAWSVSSFEDIESTDVECVTNVRYTLFDDENLGVFD